MGIIANLRNRVWILEDENKGLREEIQSLRDHYISETRKYAALHESYSELHFAEINAREQIAHLSNDVKFERNWRIEVRERYGKLHQELTRISKWANRLWRENNVLRNREIEMTREIQAHKSAHEMSNELFRVKNNRIAQLEAVNKSHEITMLEMNESITGQYREIAELREANERLENDLVNPEREIEIVAEISVAHFEHVNDVIGIAPCGYGCPVKRDNSGRIYDAHEIGCPDSLDFDIENMRY